MTKFSSPFLAKSPLRIECPDGMIYNKDTKKCEKVKKVEETQEVIPKPSKVDKGNGGTWKDKCGEGFYKNSKGECVPL